MKNPILWMQCLGGAHIGYKTDTIRGESFADVGDAISMHMAHTHIAQTATVR